MSEQNSEQNKAQLRHTLLQQRQALTPLVIEQSADQASQLFFSLDVYKQCHSLAIYFSYKNELDTGPIIARALRDKKKIFLPVVQNELLEFYSYQLGDALIDNRFGIPEPNTLQQVMISPAAIDLIVLPCTACDVKGHRLGSGGGYYDRTLAFKHHVTSTHPVLICLAYDFQKVDSIQGDPWDINVDGLLTEKEYIQVT